jgi:hypothetical protein
MGSRHRLFSIGVVVAVLALASIVLAQSDQAVESDTTQSLAPLNVDSLIAKINENIEGKEELPAEEVFKDIKILNGIPAGRVPLIMKFGFSRGLGVDCRHCHDVGDLASNENPKKQVAREMWAMSKMINEKLMEIPNLESKQPRVNCTTCHRGDVQPATKME